MKPPHRHTGPQPFTGPTDPTWSVVVLGLVALIVLIGIMAGAGEVMLRLFDGVWGWAARVTPMDFAFACMVGGLALVVSFVIMWCVTWTPVIAVLLVLESLQRIIMVRRESSSGETRLRHMRRWVGRG